MKFCVKQAIAYFAVREKGAAKTARMHNRSAPSFFLYAAKSRFLAMKHMLHQIVSIFPVRYPFLFIFNFREQNNCMTSELDDNLTLPSMTDYNMVAVDTHPDDQCRNIEGHGSFLCRVGWRFSYKYLMYYILLYNFYLVYLQHIICTHLFSIKSEKHCRS